MPISLPLPHVLGTIGGDWDEDDFISLHALSPGCNLPDESNQVTFEYTAAPKLTSDGSLRGVTQIPLPFYGGTFSLRYQRVTITVLPSSQQIRPHESSVDDPGLQGHPFTQNALVSREYLPLTSSELFSITFDVQLQSKLCRAKNGRGYKLDEPVVRDLSYLVEDLQNIHALVVTVVSTKSTPNQFFTKPTSWLHSDASGSSLILECDIFESGIVPPQPYWISIPLPSDGFNFLWLDSYGLVEVDSRTSTPFGNRIVIKIPYATKATPPSMRLSKMLDSSTSFCGLVCRSCGVELLSHQAVSKLLPLPSGLFDQVMHEFLCSETQPTMPLSMTDFTTPRGNISIGEIFLSVHPPDLRVAEAAGRLQFHCKMAPTLLDVIGGSLVKSLPQYGLSEHTSTLSLVDASTCSVKCSRCCSILGDGLIASDLDCHENPSPSEAIHLADLQDVRFLRSEVRWRPCGLEAGWGGEDLVAFLTEPCTAEQIVSNSFLWLVNRYDITSFELRVPDWTDGSARTTLRLKLLSRSQREGDDHQVSRLRSGYSIVQSPEASSPVGGSLPFRRAVKLSYRICFPGTEEKKTKGVRPISIPVSFSDYCEVGTPPSLNL